MVIALGHEYAGMFANDETLAAKLLKAADASGDKLWRQPLGDAYDRLIDSPIADMKNVGPREAGSITAAQFIKRFIDDGVAWAHLDIAGMAWSDKAETTLFDKGATGYGVRLLDQFIADTVEGWPLGSMRVDFYQLGEATAGKRRRHRSASGWSGRGSACWSSPKTRRCWRGSIACCGTRARQASFPTALPAAMTMPRSRSCCRREAMRPTLPATS